MVNFGNIATGGAYFKGDDYSTATALLVEPKHLDPQVPTKFGPKDTLEVDITVFPTVEDIDNDTGEVRKGVKIQQVDLVNKMKHLVGSADAVIVVKLPSSAQLPNGAWVWRQVAPEVRSKVIAHAQRREVAGKAAADELPDY